MSQPVVNTIHFHSCTPQCDSFGSRYRVIHDYCAVNDVLLTRAHSHVEISGEETVKEKGTDDITNGYFQVSIHDEEIAASVVQMQHSSSLSWSPELRAEFIKAYRSDSGYREKLSSPRFPYVLQDGLLYVQSKDDKNTKVLRLCVPHAPHNRLRTKLKVTSWATYVDDLNGLNPEKATLMIPTLASYYREDILFKTIDIAKKSDATKSIATKLEIQQLQGLLKSGKSPDNAFVQMRLGSVAADLMARPLFSTWVKYLDDFNAQYPAKKATLFHVFTKRFEDEDLAKIISFGKTLDSTKAVATNLETQQMQVWLANGKTSDEVFTLLKLNKAEKNFFGNPLYNTWSSYMNIFNKENPGKQTDLFKILTAHYRDRPLIKILEAASRSRAKS